MVMGVLYEEEGVGDVDAGRKHIQPQRVLTESRGDAHGNGVLDEEEGVGC